MSLAPKVTGVLGNPVKMNQGLYTTNKLGVLNAIKYIYIVSSFLNSLFLTLQQKLERL